MRAAQARRIAAEADIWEATSLRRLDDRPLVYCFGMALTKEAQPYIKGVILDQLRLSSPRGPLTLEELCSRLNVRRNRRTGRFSRSDYKLYNVYSRALQALKKEKKVCYLAKAAGGPGWIMRPDRP